jgi:outer membrane protein assembly factor BamB
VFVLALAVLTATLSGQQPKPKKGAPLPPPPLLPLEQAWLVALPSPPSAAGAIDGERVYVPLQGKQLVALNRETGAAAWTQPVDTTLPPAVIGDTVYVTEGVMLRALDRATGASRWSVEMRRPAMSPGVRPAGDRVIVPMAPDEVLAFRAADGAELWRAELGGTDGPLSLTIGATALFVSTADSRVVAIALADGRKIWQQQLPGSLGEPAAGRDRVFVGSTDNFLYALNDRSGRLEWRWRTGGDVIGAVVDADAVYLTSLDNILWALNRGNGNQRWTQETGTRPVVRPRLVSGSVVVTGVVPALSGFSITNGMPMGTYAAPGDGELAGEPLIDPVLQPFRVAAAIVTRDGRVAGLRPTGLLFRELPPAPLLALPGKLLPRERR